MYIKFWGVRGSIPTPLTSQQVQNKISAVVQRIQPKDLRSAETREAFLANLPEYLMGTVGGNTTCIEVRLDDDTMVIFDCGSGIRELANNMKNKKDYIRDYNIFFTHFHWDHLQGLPFFIPQGYDPRCRLIFHSPDKELKSYLEGQMMKPYFPVTMDVMGSQKEFRLLDKSPVELGSGRVYWRKMKHPGGCYSYKIDDHGKKVIFSTDTELTEADFERTKENSDFYLGTDVLILDSQYTLDEAIEKYDWGHSSYSLAVDFAAEWNIRNLVLFHHEPQYDDNKLMGIWNSASWYLRHLENKGIKIYLASEELEITL